jgi:hypothetical protein
VNLEVRIARNAELLALVESVDLDLAHCPESGLTFIWRSLLSVFPDLRISN